MASPLKRRRTKIKGAGSALFIATLLTSVVILLLLGDALRHDPQLLDHDRTWSAPQTFCLDSWRPQIIATPPPQVRPLPSRFELESCLTSHVTVPYSSIDVSLAWFRVRPPPVS